jgi:hypothetical protein
MAADKKKVPGLTFHPKCLVLSNVRLRRPGVSLKNQFGHLIEQKFQAHDSLRAIRFPIHLVGM